MKRSPRSIVGGIVVLAIIGLIVLAWGGWLSRGDDAFAGDLNRPTPTVEGESPLQPSGSPDSVSNAPGVEAIPVTIPAVGTVDPNLPAFTEDDVRAYLDANPPFDWDPTTPRPEIISIQFLVAKDVEALINHSVPRSPEDLLCVVTVLGTFVPHLPPGATPVSQTDGSETTAFIIFDATTGNLLGQGFLREPQ